MPSRIDNPAKYRYEGRVIWTVSFWGAVAFLVAWKGHHLTGILAYIVAVLLALPLARISHAH